MQKLVQLDSPITDALLTLIAHLPTKSLGAVIAADFWQSMSDKDYMRVAVLLAQKSFNEGGCPIGAVIIDNETGQIIGKGHNTLVQENHPYNHGETSAIRDAGRYDFSKTSLFTSLSPCDVCATLICMRQFNRVIVGDITSASGNEEMLKAKNIQVEILEDQMGIDLYQEYRTKFPDLDIEDWKGKAAIK